MAMLCNFLVLLGSACVSQGAVLQHQQQQRKVQLRQALQQDTQQQLLQQQQHQQQKQQLHQQLQLQQQQQWRTGEGEAPEKAPEDHELHGGGFVRALEFKHQLRVCNAFPSGAALEVHRGREERLTSDAPMLYKACRDFMSPLKAGDKLEFRIGDANAGTFSVSDLPNNDAVLLLVVHRHDTHSTVVAFESHVFASLAHAQVAIIDTYKGSTRSTPRIMDVATPMTQSMIQARREDLRYDSVVAVNQGIYEVELDGPDGRAEAKSQLVALEHESYVVLRTGVEASQGSSYPQELVIYPNSNPGPLLHKSGGVASHAVSSAVLLLSVLTAVVAFVGLPQL